MTGLEKILQSISEDSRRTCEEITSKTDAECAAVMQQAEASAKVILSRGKVSAHSNAHSIKARAEAAAELEGRSMILSAKQEAIAYALKGAKEYILSLPSEDYFNFILKLAAANSSDSDGKILLSKRDLERIPSDFIKRLNALVKGYLILDNTPASIDGGFILVYGGVEVNCSLDAVFMSENERFSDEVASILFE